MRDRLSFEQETLALGLDAGRNFETKSTLRPGSPAQSLANIRAGRRNRTWARIVGWKKHANAVLRVLKTEGGGLEQGFAKAVEQWQRKHGLAPDGLIGPKTWAAMRREITKGPASEFDVPPSVLRLRLSAGALGDAFDEFRNTVTVPDGAIKRLRSSSTFRAMTSAIDRTYIALDKLIASGEPGDMGDDGRLTKGKFQGRRVLTIFSTGVTAFHRAHSVDNLRRTDLIEFDTPPTPRASDVAEQLLAKDWIIRILCVLAELEAPLVRREKPPAALADRIRKCVKEQMLIRKSVDMVLKEINEADKTFNIDIIFKDFERPIHVELSFYPADLLFPTPFVLTNFEHCALRELMEEFRRREKLDDTALGALMSQVNSIPLGDEAFLKMTLGFPYPMIKGASGSFELINSDFALYYFGRRVIDRRWRLFDPVGKEWKTDLDMKDMRDAHAEAYISDVFNPPKQPPSPSGWPSRAVGLPPP